MNIRLQKILSLAGLCSRRTAEKMILQGKIFVNDQKISHLGFKADILTDKIKFNGNLISPIINKPIYIMLNKPRKYITSFYDPQLRKTVYDLVKNIKKRIFSIGRLDYNSEGLLLFTNNGNFAQFIQHPKFKIKKKYLIKVKGKIPFSDLTYLERGIYLKDGFFKPLKLTINNYTKDNTWLFITINIGKNRIIRRFLSAKGLLILRLIRTNIGPIKLGKLPIGNYRPLKKIEVEQISFYN